MCGRYELNATPRQIAAGFGVLDVPAFAPTDDVRPIHRAPVIRLDRGGARRCELMRWGLIPSWAKDTKVGNRCFTAAPNTDIAPYHNRMPVFLEPAQFDRWLDPASGDGQALLAPPPDGLLVTADADVA